MQKIKSAILAATGGSGNVYRLAGKANADVRQDLLNLMPIPALPRRLCTVTRLEDELYRLAGVDRLKASCFAVAEDQLIAWLKS